MEKKVSFIDANSEKFTVDITCIGGKFSMSGSYVGGGGQCQDSIKPANKAQQRLLDMWDKYHLNDMNAGTPDQERVIEEYRKYLSALDPVLAEWFRDYDAKCLYLKIFNKYIVPHPKTGKPYKYGSEWLSRALPGDIYQQIDKLIADIINAGGAETSLSFGEEQAQEFLKSTGTKLDIKFIEYGFHFDGDSVKRDIYRITLLRGERSYNFRFGQSFNCSGKYIVCYHHEKCPQGTKLHDEEALKKVRGHFIGYGRFYEINKNFKEPTPYDVLTCLEKNDSESFEDFCSEFGYDTDSRQAEKTYNAVRDEYNNLKMLYSDSELEKMAEIS